jgi:hypothetical protein
MSRISTSLGVAAVALACLALSAEDFQPLMRAAQATWPEKQHIGVICNYAENQADVRALAQAAGSGARITVIDAKSADKAAVAATLLSGHDTDFVVLMPKDRSFGDGTYGATMAVNRLASRALPAVGTTPAALKQGAVFSTGEGTEGQILVTDKLIGTVHVVLPDRGLAKSSLVLQEEGMATITVHAAE